jgi:hypothetical protein
MFALSHREQAPACIASHWLYRSRINLVCTAENVQKATKDMFNENLPHLWEVLRNVMPASKVTYYPRKLHSRTGAMVDGQQENVDCTSMKQGLAVLSAI